MNLSVRPGSMVPIQYVLTLNTEEREAYKFVKLVEQAIEIVCRKRGVIPRMSHGQFELVVVSAARIFGHQSPLVKFDERGNCPAVTMVHTHHLSSSKNANINLNSINKEPTFVQAFPARDRLVESVGWALDATDYGKKPPKE